MPAIKVCNCAACKRELYSAATPPGGRHTAGREVLAGRFEGRPYCGRCLQRVRSYEDFLDDTEMVPPGASYSCTLTVSQTTASQRSGRARIEHDDVDR